MGLRVLSLFDGISCGRLALERAGIPVDSYYSYEIEPNAIKISGKNYPDIIQCGDVTVADFSEYKDKIDLLIGGSPCQGFSYAGKRLNFSDSRSKLFFEYVRALKTIKPKYFLLENVKMKKQWVDIISELIGLEPIAINSSFVSAQNRARLYWTNIPDAKIPENKGIKLKDVLLDIDVEGNIADFKKSVRENVVKQYDSIIASSKDIYSLRCTSGWNDNKVGIHKSPTLRANNSFCLVKDKNNKIRRITVEEAEILQTLPIGYTEGVSQSKHFQAIGNGWTVDVVSSIFEGLKRG